MVAMENKRETYGPMGVLIGTVHHDDEGRPVPSPSTWETGRPWWSLDTAEGDYPADPDDHLDMDTSATFADPDHTTSALLDYLESAGNTPGIEELVSCVLADNALQHSPTLRNSLATFGAVLCARLDV